jgi:serine/threonine protein kinase
MNDALPVRLGDVVGGRYRVERVIGSGAMGTVVAVTELAQGFRLALKLVRGDILRDPELAARFAREARAVGALTSRHAAKLFDIGQLPSGEPFIVMELLEGNDLEQVLHARGRVVPLDAVRWISEACEAIGEAHACGIVHRDLKLSNLFLTRATEGAPFVKVLDFGLAKTREAGAASLTDTGAVFGSPQYMSPEQMRSAKSVDARTDIFSLGVCLYELMTGVLPFDAPSVMEVFARVLKDTPAPFASVLDEASLAVIPVPLEACVMRCLEKDRERRWQSATELARSLEPYGGLRRT